MFRYLLHHHHTPDECGVVFASFKGHGSPLPHRATLASCRSGGHASWWTVDADSEDDALGLLPFYVAVRTRSLASARFRSRERGRTRGGIVSARKRDVAARERMTRVWWPAGKVPEIPPRDLHDALRNGANIQVIDVRTEAEFRRGHILGAVSVPILRLSKELPRLGLDQTKSVVAICKTAHRSVPAVRMLIEAGYQASQLAGGMNRWRREGLPVEKP
jgi:rhodanese-related sulfurtransferase